METCFGDRLLLWSLLLLGLPGPLRAGTPGYNSTSSVPDRFHYSAGTNSAGGVATATSPSSESLSASQRDLLLTHAPGSHAAAAGPLETVQAETHKETSSRSPEATDLSTEPLTLSSLTTNDFSSSSSSSSGFTNTNQMPLISHSVSTEDKPWLFPEDETIPQDSPNTTLRLGDNTSSASQTENGSTYTTTVGRAGERTLLSVTSSFNNSTSSVFTDDSSSRQPPSSGGVPPRPAETEGYTQSAPATRTNGGETTEQRVTGTSSETRVPVEASETPGLTAQPNATKHQLSLTSQEMSDSTAFRVTEPSTRRSETTVSSSPPFTSHPEAPVNASGTHQDSGTSVGSSTEMTGGAHSTNTQNQESTEGLLPQTSEDSGVLGLTTMSSTVSSSSETTESQKTVPEMVTGVFLTTTPVTTTESLQTTEEIKSTSLTTATMASTGPPLPATSATIQSSVSSSYTTETTTEVIPLSTLPSSSDTQPALKNSAAPPAEHMSPSQTQRPSTKTVIPTKATTIQTETSTGTKRLITTQSRYIDTTYSHSIPARSTEAMRTFKKQTEGEPAVTTVPTKVQTARVPQRNPCVSNPCMNGGMCVSYKGPEYTCLCQKAWTGPTCDQDMDECEQDPCPAGSTCANTKGSFSCECPLGYDLEDGRTCSRAKTFLGTFSFNTHDQVKSSTMHEIQREIIQLLNVSLSVLQGYTRSTLSRKDQGGVHIFAVNMFSVSTDVSTTEVYNSIQMSLSNCSSSLTHCRMVLQHLLSYQMESLCEAQKTQCDADRSTCTDSSGTASCQCLQGYYKHNPEDLSCLECRDGYWLENGTCVPCIFGFGGFNCANFYKLIAVVVSPAGGAILIILIIALIVTCCKKDKNDINKIIFKSGDMQRSPYADFPKNSRISMEWGRETIEMQENGSTKNLLQMTDIYYSPALRNSDLERNGLYPFTGLPGSRHSCIYPAQFNPSFISDDSRRRDYF